MAEQMSDEPQMPDLSAFPKVQHRIERGKFICPGNESDWCHRYPGDECDHEYWPCGHEYVGHARCWVKPWIDAVDLADSYAGVEHELLLRDEDFPDGDVDWSWEGDYVTFDYAPTREAFQARLDAVVLAATDRPDGCLSCGGECGGGRHCCENCEHTTDRPDGSPCAGAH